MIVSIETLAPGTAIEALDRKRVRELFMRYYYYRYHYLDDIEREDRARFLARTRDGALV